MRWIFILMFFVTAGVSAQCKTYIIGVKGDTLNCTDMQNKKQGKWVIHVESLRGEPGYEEEGVFKDDKKEGIWRKSSLMGDILAIEQYKWGVKDGRCQYFNLEGLIREESWKAIDPLNPYDTVKVVDLSNPDKYSIRIMKVASTTVKQGTWTYYNPETGTITKTEDYVLDQLQQPDLKTTTQASGNPTDTTAGLKKTGPVAKPPAVLEYEKKNSGKKKIRVRDGSTGGGY